MIAPRPTKRPPPTDDRGRPVTLLRSAGFAEWPLEGDPRISALMRRMELARRPGVRLMPLIAVTWAGLTLALIFAIRRWWPGAPGWLGPGIQGAVGGLVLTLLFRALLRARAPQIAPMLTDEGLCASCGYNLAGVTPAQDGLITCPECGAAWSPTRMRRRRPFEPASVMGNPLEALGHRRGGPRRSHRAPTTRDALGRRVDLARAHLIREVRAATGERRGRLLAARRDIARAGRWTRRALIALLVSLLPICAAALLAWNRLPPQAFAALIIGYFAATGLAFALHAILTRRAVAPALLARGLCPTCAAEIGPPDPATGLAECPACYGVWRPPPGAPAPTPSSAPALAEPSPLASTPADAAAHRTPPAA
jgi:Zn-finger nucleic acid-binding protein